MVMTRSEYEAIDAVSQSQLKAFIESRRKFEALYVNRTMTYDSTDQMVLGTLVHLLTLTPDEFDSQVAIIPQDVLTSNGQRRGKAWEEWQDANEHKAHLIRMQDYQLAKGIAKRLRAHPFLTMALGHAESIERPIVWQDSDTGLMLKGIPDIVCDDRLRFVVDIKTTASLSSFVDDSRGRYISKAMGNLGYHIQAAYYLDGVREAYGREAENFALLVAETQAPYRVLAMHLADGAIEVGRATVRRALQQLRMCRDTNDFSEDGEGNLLVVDLPSFMYGEI